jgi:hypothetical protein
MNRLLIALAFLSQVPFYGASARAADAAGTLSVVTTPRAQVYIDDKPVGRSPLKGLSVTRGHHRVAYESKAQGTRVEFDVLIREGKKVDCSYDFGKGENNCTEERAKGTAEKPPTSIDMVSEPASEVYLDGKWIGKSPVKKVHVGEGFHQVEFRHPDYESILREVDVKPGENVQVKGTFTGGKKETPPADETTDDSGKL